MVIVFRDGSRLTPWMLYCIELANAEFRALFGVVLMVTSGIRTHQQQITIFLSKYRVQWFGKGPYRDVRWWKGKRYVRHVGGGTVAPPGKSNHEIQGDMAAVDLRDSGSDPGVSKLGNERENWLRKNGPRFGLEPEGYSFGEPWHYRIRDIYKMPPAAPAGETKTDPVIAPEEDEDSMKMLGYRKSADGRIWYARFDTGSGFWSEMVTSDPGYAREQGSKWTTNGIPLVTEKDRDDLKAECDRISGRAG